MTETSQRRGAFTLIELLIVIALISILAALAIPNIISARKGGYESVAISQLRTIVGAEQVYKARNLGGAGQYGTIAEMEAHSLLEFPAAGAPYLKSGYIFTDIVAPTDFSWCIGAEPDFGQQSGDRDFVASSDGFIRYQNQVLTLPATIAATRLLPAIPD